MKLLLVERNDRRRERLHHLLKAFGHDVESTWNFTRAMEMLYSTYYDLISHDIDGVGGRELWNLLANRVDPPPLLAVLHVPNGQIEPGVIEQLDKAGCKARAYPFDSREYINAFNIVYALLYCPRCGYQHLDTPGEGIEPGTKWRNPPHKDHYCHKCKKIFKVAQNSTYGVAEHAITDTQP